MSTVIAHFVVGGIPRPKGSLRHIGRGRMVEQSTDSAEWRERVMLAARDTLWAAPIDRNTPVELRVEFRFPKPKKTKYPVAPIASNIADLDKAVRNIGDALADAHLIENDAQVVAVRAVKRWAAGNEMPGATITVLTVDPLAEEFAQLEADLTDLAGELIIVERQLGLGEAA